MCRRRKGRGRGTCACGGDLVQLPCCDLLPSESKLLECRRYACQIRAAVLPDWEGTGGPNRNLQASSKIGHVGARRARYVRPCVSMYSSSSKFFVVDADVIVLL